MSAGEHASPPPPEPGPGTDDPVDGLRRLLGTLEERAADASVDREAAIVDAVRAAERLLRRIETSERSAVEQGARDALRQLLAIEQERYRGLFDFAPEAWFVTDSRGVIREANEAAGELLGVEARELRGRELHDLGPRSRRADVAELLARIRDGGERVRFDWAVATRHRSVVPVTVVGAAVPGSGKEGVPGIRWHLSDASERHRAEQTTSVLDRVEAERAEAERDARHFGLLARVSDIVSTASLDYRDILGSVARELVDGLADRCVIWLREEGEVRPVGSASTARRTERSAAKFRADYGLSGSGWSEALHRMIDSGGTWLLCEDLLGERGEGHGIRRREEATGVCRGVIAPLSTVDRGFGALGLLDLGVGPGFTTHEVDLAVELAKRTALGLENARLYLEAKRALRERDRVQRMVSHDLRNELTKFTLLLDSLQARIDEEDEESRRDVRRAERTAAQIISLVDDLDPSHPSHGDRVLHRQPIDVASLAREVADGYELMARRGGVKLRVEVEDDLPRISGDEERLSQVLGNLIQNGVKFTPSGGEVVVRARRCDDGAELSVLDTGPGVREEELERIFDRFWRGEAAAGVEGIGLGLAIARTLVEAHGGEIGADNREDGGLGVSFRLPTADDPEPEAREAETSRSEGV